LLAQHGIFNQAFTFGSEDVELAFRLTRHNLQIIHNRHAVQYMNRPVTFPEFCARCERQGRSDWTFSQLHPELRIRTYCGVIDAETRWAESESQLGPASRRIKALEAQLQASDHHTPNHDLIQELHPLYRL